MHRQFSQMHVHGQAECQAKCANDEAGHQKSTAAYAAEEDA